MKRSVRWLAGAVAAVVAGVPAAIAATPERPADPWVIRSVLDKRARMVSIGLSKDLWVAYDGATCGLYKAWKGGLKLDGAVYTTVHGPQPTVNGAVYSEGLGEKTWQVVRGKDASAVEPVYRGHRIEDGRVHLMYDVPVGEGRFAHVDESPEAVTLEGGAIGLERRFAATGVPEGVVLAVGVNPDFLKREGAAFREGTKGMMPMMGMGGGSSAWFPIRLSGGAEPVAYTQVFGAPPADAEAPPAPPPANRGALPKDGKGIETQAGESGSDAKQSRGGGDDGVIDVFYCTHSAGFKHDVLPYTRELMTRLGAELDWLEVTASDSITDLTAARLAKTDVVMLYTSGTLPMGRMQGWLMEWVAKGGALVGVHSATDTLHDSAPFVKFIGGEFESHPWNQAVNVVVEDRDHPAVGPFLEGATAGPDGKAVFTIADEIYQFKNVNPDMHVLLSLSPETPGAEQGRTYPLAWTLQPGEGRVFYTAFGHRDEVWRDQRFVNHLLAGVKWAAGVER